MSNIRRTSCSVDGCQRYAGARGLCHSHYEHWRVHGDAGPAILCIVTGCGKARHRGPYCCAHAHKFWRYGSADDVDRRGREPIKCSVFPCNRRAQSRGLCATHASQVRREGRVTRPVPRKIAPRGAGSTQCDGYRVVVEHGHPNCFGKKKGTILEHRLVVSRFLGRPLTGDETVHHRNKIRHENTVGPCVLHNKCTCGVSPPHNLELWSGNHPAGARVSDLVAFAKDVLRRYCR